MSTLRESLKSILSDYDEGTKHSVQGTEKTLDLLEALIKNQLSIENILDRANEIVNERSEEKERQYGPFSECMDRTADIASVMSSKKISTIDAFNVLIALKFARQSFNHKQDNLLDAVAYIGALDNYITDNQNKHD